jgi:hypothetical protein
METHASRVAMRFNALCTDEIATVCWVNCRASLELCQKRKRPELSLSHGTFVEYPSPEVCSTITLRASTMAREWHGWAIPRKSLKWQSRVKVTLNFR